MHIIEARPQGGGMEKTMSTINTIRRALCVLVVALVIILLGGVLNFVLKRRRKQ